MSISSISRGNAHAALAVLAILTSCSVPRQARAAERMTSVHPAESVSITDARVEIVLPNQHRVTGQIAHQSSRFGDEIIQGKLDDASVGDFTLVRRDSRIAGVVRTASGQTFEIATTPDGVRELTEVNRSSRFSCGDYLSQYTRGADKFTRPSNSPGQTSNEDASPSDTHPRGIPITGCDSGFVIDVMVVYTEAAKIAAGGQAAIEMRIASAVSDTNSAFSNSGISCFVNLVHRQEVAYTETGDSLIDGPRLLDPNDGFLDNVHALREQHAADIAILWVSSLEVGGRVFAPMEPTGASGFHEMRQDNWSLLTMAHELGHNLGCAHDRPNAFPDNYFSYSYGYHEPGGAWHTIMAVVPPNTPVIPHFSNPSINFGGLPTGVPIGMPDESHCAATINKTKLIVANYRLAPEVGLPTRLYVNAAASPGGDGTSWALAMDDLQNAICQARRSSGAVQEIWVRAGTYYPDLNSDLEQMAFYLRDNLAIYGGFAGTETMLAQRNPVTNVTILSGEIGSAMTTLDNSNNVVMSIGNGATARLDGFTITKGSADTSNLYFTDDGAGMRCDGSSPTVANCTFSMNAVVDAGGGMVNLAFSSPNVLTCTFANNTAERGGGMGNLEDSAPLISGCTFLSNEAASFGGGMYSILSSPIVTDTNFEMNVAEDSGGVMNWESSVIFDTCTFGPGNTSLFAAGGVHNAYSDGTFLSCEFTANESTYAGGMRNFASALTISLCDFNLNLATAIGGSGGAVGNELDPAPLFDQCTFSANTADYAGAMDNFACAPELVDCEFTLNDADNGGGAVGNFLDSQASLVRCQFFSNTAGFGGAVYCLDVTDVAFTGCEFFNNSANDAGAMYFYNAGSLVDGCRFEGNTAGVIPSGLGGAIGAVVGSNPVIRRCTFIDNSAGGSGGAIWLDSSPAILASSYLLGNFSDWSGGAIENIASDSLIAGCVFSGNTATNSHGGAVTIAGAVSPTLANDSFSGNHAGFAGGALALDAANPTSVSNCLLWGNTDPNGSAQSQQIQIFGGSIDINYSSVEGWTGSLGGLGNNGSDPIFADADGGDDTPGTEDDDLRIASGSPAVDSGDNTRVPLDAADLDVDMDLAERHPLDLDDQPRFADDPATADTGVTDPPTYLVVVDRGAYEVQFIPGECGTCPGDVNGDNNITGADIQMLIDCILAGPFIGPGCECADTDNSFDLNSADVPNFVTAAISVGGCP
ncbi:MAG: hypothetical protein HS101_01880 [Planctomycetia bacterium]|nr:hypothetical protein [Planctomycetia bacterium]